MRSPQTIGVECPLPGMAVFQRMFFVSLHSTGGCALGATPVPNGPRQWAQASCGLTLLRAAFAGTAYSDAIATMPIRRCISVSFSLPHGSNQVIIFLETRSIETRSNHEALHCHYVPGAWLVRNLASGRRRATARRISLARQGA